MSSTENDLRGVRRISAFSVILIMVVMMLIGGAMVPLLKVQYNPSERREGFSVSFNWPGVSARVVEAEVTSKIEGVLNSIDGVADVSANSWRGGGSVWLGFKKGTRMDAARFEVAAQVRQLYDKLPSGVSYPWINMSLGGSTTQTIMTYTINADLPPWLIVKWAEDNLTPELSRIEGVERVELSGATPFEWIVTFEANLLREAGISTGDISNAFNSRFRETIAGDFTEDGKVHTVRLWGGGGLDLENIPVKKVGTRIFYLRDVATVQYRESLPTSYFRINGLNTVYMNFTANEGINTIEVASRIRETLASLESTLPRNYTLNLTYDSSEALREEINTILFRSVLSLLILLGFVWIVSRSLRYLALIGLTIVANLLAAVIFYYLFGVQIEMISLAGITVSLGIIIDTSIVMIDHFSYYRNRKIFTSILGAILTTIAALLVIFFLPDEQKNNLVDFVWVIVINLTISVVIAFFFIPSLLEKVPIERKGVVRTRTSGRRRLVRFSNLYERYILWGRAHRWIFVVLLVFGFGFPVHLLPAEVGKDNPRNREKTLVKFYNKTIGGTWYQNNKEIFEKALGGSFRYFAKGYNPESFFSTPEPRKTITIRAGMPEGCSVHQLNDIIKEMENYLSQYDQIDMYRTSVNSYNSGNIIVTFKKEFENTSFPVKLFDELTRQASSYGGANWYVLGVLPDQRFSNYIGGMGGYRSHGIRLKGYNYDILYRYARLLVDSLSSDKRVGGPNIYSNDRYQMPENEFFIEYDREKIARTGLDLGKYWGFLYGQLYQGEISRVFDGNETTRVVLASSEMDTFDRWHVGHDMIAVDTIRTRLMDVGTIEMRRSGNNIVRNNQEYELVVGFDFVGAYELASRRVDVNIKMMNETVLPIGHKAERVGRGMWASAKDNWRMAGLLMLVIVIIYSLCAIIFESLRKPFVILLLIPVGFIGLFLTFALGKFTFNQGGFAAMVMMCGIVVNAGIYIVHEYNVIRRGNPGAAPVPVYVRAYNRKIVPTMLTIVSTVLGLIPFLFDGNNNGFWFSFAVGVMGSMIFSVIALVIYLPVFFPFGRKV